ncbi:MAG TPA: hypothetical protein VG322_11325 [Candidatus Acidoferrales bacterium]|nr:hypothetical protein [Candidatus Acidoferrales bacterium]
MANLKVTIVVRVAQNGKRSWLPASGKGDPSGSYYLRYCQGKIPKYVKVKTGNTYDQAEIACMKLERKLKAQSQGFIIPDTAPDVTQHRITDVIAVYLAKLAAPGSDGDPTPIKSQNAAKSELEKFAAWSGKTYVEEIDREVLLAFRRFLYTKGLQQNTVRNKMVQVLSWLKTNGVVPYVPLLVKGDLPKPKTTKPDPYSQKEWEEMKALATPEELLLTRFLRGTGLRNGECSVAEREDIVWDKRIIQVKRRKPKFNWKAKNDTAKRDVPLPTALLEDLRRRGPGLLFPRNGHRDKHLLDIVKSLALRVVAGFGILILMLCVFVVLVISNQSYQARSIGGILDIVSAPSFVNPENVAVFDNSIYDHRSASFWARSFEVGLDESSRRFPHTDRLQFRVSNWVTGVWNRGRGLIEVFHPQTFVDYPRWSSSVILPVPAKNESRGIAVDSNSERDWFWQVRLVRRPTDVGQQPGTFGINHRINLFFNGLQGSQGSPYAAYPDKDQEHRWQVCSTKKATEVAIRFACGCYGLLFGGLLVYSAKTRRLCNVVGPTLVGLGLAAFLFPPYYAGDCDNNDNHQPPFLKPSHRDNTVPPQYPLTRVNYRGTVIAIGRTVMANILPIERQIAVISALAEGSGIRQAERMTGVNRETIMKLGVRVGKGCALLLDRKMRDLSCRQLQFDEIWGFIGKKERHVRPDDDPTMGDVWTFCAIDPQTKIVPSFKCGKRDSATANAFVADVASRMKTRVQVSSDALRAYVEAVENAFGSEVDFAQIIKTYSHDESILPERRFSAPEVVTTEKKRVSGFPNMRLASTSHIERLNGTTRLHMRRLTRLTYAFSKKRENFEAATALHFAYYNFVKRHNSLRVTPAMEAGIERDFWSVGQLIEAAA